MSAKSENLAGDLARSYNYVRRFHGVLFSDDEGDWVLSRPEFPTGKLGELADLLLTENPPRQDLAQAIGAKEILHITPGKLGKAHYHFSRLSHRAQLKALIEEGVRPLRNFRGRDIDALLDRCVNAVERAANGPFGCEGSNDLVLATFEDGAAILDKIQDAQHGEADETQLRLRRLEDFVLTAEHVVRGKGPPRPELRRLWTQLEKLEDDGGRRRDRALLAAFREFVAEQEPHELGKRRALEAVVRGQPVAIAAAQLAEFVAPMPAEPAPWSDADRRNLLELALRLRGENLALPSRRGRGLQTLLEYAHNLSLDTLGSLWPRLLELNQQQLDTARWPLFRSKLSGPILGDALELGVLGHVEGFETHEGLAAYLDAVRRLRDQPVPHLDPNKDWFIEPFRSGRSWEAPFVLGLLAFEHEQPESVIATLVAARTTGFADLGFVDAFEQWDAPVVHERPAQFESVREVLDLDLSALERYLHWRRLTGHGETFSETLIKPLRLKEEETRELEHLLSQEPTPKLEQRIARLRSDEGHALRLDAAVKRARNAFDRALEVLRQESLEAAVQQTARGALEQLLGRKLDGPLPARIRAVMLLVGAENIDLAALRSMLEDVLDHRALAERPANAKWLKTMRSRGIDTARWLEGVDFQIEVRGEALRFQTEANPLHVLEMGSYFDTCLSLEDGFNAASTLTNALDANKQVLYGRRADGTVVARKLLAATDDGMLLGYRTYAFEHRLAIDATLGPLLAQFATDCGLSMSSEGRPTALHETFWYDDGAEAWTFRRPPEVPSTVPPDTQAAAEWAYNRGFIDADAWRWAAAISGGRWSDSAAVRLWMAGETNSRALGVWRNLASRGHFEWLCGSDPHPWQQIEAAAPVLPMREDAVRDFAKRVHSLKLEEATWMHDHMVTPPFTLALLSVPEVVTYLIDHVRAGRSARLECFIEAHDDCIELMVQDAADIVTIAAKLRDGGEAIVRLLSHRDPIVRRIGVECATRLSHPKIGKRLRAMLKEEGPDGRLEWAVARQRDKASTWQLTNWLQANPTDLEVAAALVVLGSAELGELARNMIELPDECDCHPAVIRILQPERLPRNWLRLPEDEEQQQWAIARLLATAHSDANPEALGVSTTRRMVAFRHARQLRDALPSEWPSLWANYFREEENPALHPSDLELRLIVRAALRPDPDLGAVQFLLNSRYMHRLAGVPFVMKQPASTEIRELVTRAQIPTWRAARMRYFHAILGEETSAAFLGTDCWDTEDLLGPELGRWRIHVHSVATNVSVQLALTLCDFAMNVLVPDDATALVEEVLAEHEVAVLRVIDEVIAERLPHSEWDANSYRLVEMLVTWAVPKIAPEVVDEWLDASKGERRAEWLRGLAERTR